jgi:hypothetical protein
LELAVKPGFLFSVLSAAATALACASLPAHAVGSLADVTVIDRNSGASLPVYYHRGDYWVAGKPGAAYAISVRNKTGERVLAVTSVDGVNVLSGDAAGWGQTGYVFGPYFNYQITGWRKSDSEVAAFEFSAASDSYASRTGRPDQVGVIGVALFREQQPVQVQPQIQTPRPDHSSRRESFHESSRDALNEAPAMRQKSAPAPAPAAASPPTPAAGMADRSSSDASGLARNDSASERAGASAAAPKQLEKLGTAHGQRETSWVSHTNFARLQSQPNEIIRIRYDSRERLIASGVIREPVRQQPTPDAFPESARASYVPDPPTRY